ncbi:hypothetical protein IWX49DRAFT_561006, partial [Phyllosticta citricarpa]
FLLLLPLLLYLFMIAQGRRGLCSCRFIGVLGVGAIGVVGILLADSFSAAALVVISNLRGRYVVRGQKVRQGRIRATNAIASLPPSRHGCVANIVGICV